MSKNNDKLPILINFILMTLNIHSLINKLDHLDHFIKGLKDKPLLFLITETWLKSDRFFHNIPGYSPIFINRSGNTRGGGICFYIDERINFNVTLSEEFMNSYVIIIELPDFGIRVGGVYRDPSCNTNIYLEYLDNLFERHQNCIWIGDMNFDLLSDNLMISNYKNTLASNNIRILNQINLDAATYFHTSHGSSILDHAVTDLNNFNFETSTHTVGFSDHDALFVKGTPILVNATNNTTRHIDYMKLNRLIPGIARSNANCVDVVVSKLSAAITSCTSFKCTRPNNDHWMSQEILQLMSERDRYKRLHRKFLHNVIYISNYRRLRNTVTNKMREAKRDFYHRQFQACMNESRKVWQLMNDLLFGKKSQSRSKISSILTDDGNLLTDDNEICDYLAKYYVQVGVEVADSIAGPANDPLPLVTENTSRFLLSPVTTPEVLKTICELKSSVSPGADGITVKMIKYHKNLFATLFCRLINRSFTSGKFDKSLKVATACVIHKSGDKRKPSNYRFISVLSVVSKIFEKCINTRLLNFFESTGYLSKQQFGFISGSDTSTATTELVSFLQKALNDGHLAASIFIDVSKAFDSVNHNLLLKKLKRAGIDGTALHLLEDYLSNRPVSVKNGPAVGNPQTMRAAVPQGSILSTTMFLIFINDIFQLNLHGRLQLYADDASIIYSSKDPVYLNKIMNEDCALINEWFVNNKLAMNVKKSCFMLFHHGKKQIHTPINLHVAGSKIDRVNSFKYLGLVLDTSLNWSAHINFIAAKIASIIGALSRAAYHLHSKTKLSLYYAHVHSHLCYMAHLWGAAGRSRIDMLQILQNKAVRAIFKLDYNQPGIHTHHLLSANKIMNVKNLAEFSAAMSTYKILQGQARCTINLVPASSVHNHQTRNRNHIRRPIPRNKWGSALLEFRGSRIYNQLPEDVKNQQSMFLFKKTLKEFLLLRR